MQVFFLHIKLIRPLVLDHEIIFGFSLATNALHPQIFTDPVIYVNNVIARLNIHERLNGAFSHFNLYWPFFDLGAPERAYRKDDYAFVPRDIFKRDNVNAFY